MSNRLFQPLRVGKVELAHRLVMAPLTRYRADKDHVPLPFVKTYYDQRATIPGSLIITEATNVSPQATGEAFTPGIWTPAQIEGWKAVTSAVHARKSFIFMQLWAVGRTAAAAEYGLDVVSSSAVRMDEQHAVPRELRDEEIWQLVADYAQAARNAIEAGFDGVELHAANGYLIDQFIQDVVNKRTDAWGGSVEKRSRFALEVTKAVVAAIGADRVGIRLSPWSTFQGMRMQDPLQPFLYLVRELKKLNLAYLHLVEARATDSAADEFKSSSTPFVEAWGKQSPVFLAGGFTSDTASHTANQEFADSDVAVVFGRHYISNPDLAYRIEKGLPMSDYDRSTFYKAGAKEGYITPEFSAEYKQEFADRVQAIA